MRRRRRRRTTTTTAPLERLHCIALTSSSLLVGPNNCLTHSFSPFPSFPSFTPSSVRLSNFLCFPFHEKEKKEGGKAGWLVGRSVNCGGRGTWSCKQCPFPTRPLSLSLSLSLLPPSELERRRRPSPQDGPTISSTTSSFSFFFFNLPTETNSCHFVSEGTGGRASGQVSGGAAAAAMVNCEE